MLNQTGTLRRNFILKQIERHTCSLDPIQHYDTDRPHIVNTKVGN